MRNFAKKLFQKSTHNNNGKLNRFLNEVLVPRIAKFFPYLPKARAAKCTIKMREKRWK